jgi:transcriptional regulator with XRE-family HTH domain
MPNVGSPLRSYYIYNTIHRIVIYEDMNEIQEVIVELQKNGWTLAAIADELEITVNAVEKWKAGDRQPRNSKAVIMLLYQLLERKQDPKKKRYVTSRQHLPIVKTSPEIKTRPKAEKHFPHFEEFK